MRTSTVGKILFASTFALTGCGGSGGSFVASTPTPQLTPVSPTAAAFVPAATTSQQFTAIGATHGLLDG